MYLFIFICVSIHRLSILFIILFILFTESILGPPLWCSGQSFWLLSQVLWVRFPALLTFSE
jgi:hypothetical protein